MEVILVKQQGRNGDAQRSPKLDSRWFAWELEQVAAQEQVQIVDLFNLWQDYCISIGADKTTQLYMNGDTLHPNRAGAQKLAELFAVQFQQTPAPTEPLTEPEPIGGNLIQNVQIFDTANQGAWSIADGIQPGSKVFGDRDFTFTAVPDYLQDAEILRTACNSKKFMGDQANFTVAEDVTVYLGADTRLNPPEWLSAWTKTVDVLTDDGNPIATYALWKRDYQAGETVTVGINGDSGTVNYVVAVQPYEAPTDPPTDEPTEPPAEPTQQPTEPQNIAGDVDGDGTLHVADVIMLQKWLLCSGMLTDSAAADLNTDGCVDVFDLALLKRLLIQNDEAKENQK